MKNKGRELHIGGCKGAGRQRLLVVELKGWRSRSFVCLCCPLHFGNIWPLIFLAWVVSSLRLLCHLVCAMAWFICYCVISLSFEWLSFHSTFEFTAWLVLLILHDMSFWAWLFCCIFMTFVNYLSKLEICMISLVCHLIIPFLHKHNFMSPQS